MLYAIAANRMAEVNEMWRLKEKELELEKRMHSRKYLFEYHERCKSERSRNNPEDGNNSKHIEHASFKEVDGNENDFSASENANCTQNVRVL